MALGDILVLEHSSTNGRGSRTFNVAAGATAILAGEPVVYQIGGAVTVSAMATNSPVSGSDYFVGIAQTNSTQTAGTAGIVGVLPVTSQTTFLIKPTVAASWDTQSEYDALVGKSVLIDLTSGSYTLLATGGANSTNGCVVQSMNIADHPGQVAIAFKAGTSNLR